MVDSTEEPRGLAGHLKDALIGAHGAVADNIAERKKQHVADVLEQFERDLAPMLGPLIQHALDNPATPDHFKPILQEAANPEHFSGSLFIGVAAGAILGPVLGSALEPYIQGIANAAWANNPSRPLTPDVLVATVLKGIQDAGSAGQEAALSGIAQGRFSTMVEAAGQALGFEQALELDRRGLLVGVTLQQVLEYSNVNPKFYASALNLKTNPVSTAEVLNARIREHLDDGQARDLYAQAGGIPAEYDWRLASVGRPPGPMQIGELFNRKIIGDTEASAMLAQSDLALAYQDRVKELWKYYPPPRSLVPMLRSEAITEGQFRTWMSYYGAPPDVVDAFIKEANHSTSTTAKTLTQAQVTASYELRLLTRAEALTRLETAKFSPADATAILDLADEKRQQAMDNAVVRMIGSRYVTRKLTKPEATTQLNAVPIPTAAQGDLFHLWDIERTITVHHLTPSQVIGGYRRGQITASSCKTRLLALGVQQEDMGILVADGFPPTKPLEAQAAADAVVNA